ncbi:unnamed protein product, partial [Ectocarpus sp. 12 AP-2014]
MCKLWEGILGVLFASPAARCRVLFMQVPRASTGVCQWIEALQGIMQLVAMYPIVERAAWGNIYILPISNGCTNPAPFRLCGGSRDSPTTQQYCRACPASIGACLAEIQPWGYSDTPMLICSRCAPCGGAIPESLGALRKLKELLCSISNLALKRHTLSFCVTHLAKLLCQLLEAHSPSSRRNKWSRIETTVPPTQPNLSISLQVRSRHSSELSTSLPG